MPSFAWLILTGKNFLSITWSNTVDRARKEQVVAEIGHIFESSGVIVVAKYEGMSVSEMESFRGEMREAGGFVRVAKNRLSKIAIQGSPAEGIESLLNGMTVLAYSEDPVSAAKIADRFAKKSDHLEIVGGIMDKAVLDPSGVKAVANMPSRDELLASVVSCIGSPAANLAAAIGSPASSLASLLETLSEQEAV